MSTSPVRSRPHIPDYGVPEDEEGMLPWSYITERLASAAMYWVCTTGPDGSPHAVPYWGGLVEDVLYFETAPTTRGGRNLRLNPAVAVHLISGDEVVILEGVARTAVPNPRVMALLQEAYKPKYDGYFPPTADNLYAVEPVVAFAWDLRNFPGSMTRWHFRDVSEIMSPLGDE